MGKKLIIKGADFSANAIEGVLPSRYDYELLGVFDAITNVPNYTTFTGYLIVFSDKTVIKRFNNGTKIEDIPLTDGLIVKLSNNLYGIFNSETGDFDWRTENDEEINVSILPASVYIYDSSDNSFTLESGDTSWVCASAQVNAGDIIFYKGAGGIAPRLFAMKNNSNQIEYIIGTGNGNSNPLTVPYIAPSNGTIYWNSNKTVGYSIKILR
jgi:hypothetical protein